MEIFDIIPASQEEAEVINNKLFEFDKSQGLLQERIPILKNYVIKDNGAIIAGINIAIYHWGILYIDVLFVDEQYRGQRLGSVLLAKVESEAKAMGATLVRLDTFDFQAKDFYLKHGYEILGVLEDCPKGHTLYYLKKNL